MRKQDTVFVRNHGAKPFRDRYDGEDIVIGVGAAVEMEVEAAKLIFGFGEKDKRRAIQRLGWAPTQDDMQGALARLREFSFHTGTSAPDDDLAPARLSAPASDVEAAGAAGEGVIVAPSDEPAAAGQEQQEQHTAAPKSAAAPNAISKLARVAQTASAAG